MRIVINTNEILKYSLVIKMVFKKSFIFYLVLINSLILFSGCNKCEDKQIAVCNFTSEDLKINPYNGNEVLSFKSISGDSLKFSVGDRMSGLMQVYLTPKEGDCGGSYASVETNSTELSSIGNSWQFSIFMRFAPNPLTSGGYYKAVVFGAVWLGQIKEANSISPVIFEQDTLTRYRYYWPNEELLFYKIINLGSKSFSDVYEFDLILQEATSGKWINKMYYNIKQGIVGFSIYPDDTWYLK